MLVATGVRTKFHISDANYRTCHLYLPKAVVDGRLPSGLPAGCHGLGKVLRLLCGMC